MDSKAIEAVSERSLVKKLCRIMKKVGYLQKTGTNEKQGYKYATEADVAEELREKFADENIFIFPNVVRNERTRIERPGYKEGEVKVSYATDVEIEWTFVDGDSGEAWVCRIPGSSETPGDKGVYVAMTGSEKYLLMKSFLIPTGDDPESDDNEPRGTKEDAKAVGERKLEEYKAKERAQLEAEKASKPHTSQAAAVVKSAPIAPDRVYGDDIQRRPTPPMAPITKIVEKQKKDKSGAFWIVTWEGKDYTTFDSTVHGHLAAAKQNGEEAALYTSEKPNPNRPGQPYRNLDGIYRIHNQFFEDDGKTPFNDVNQDLMDADEYPE